MFVVYLLFFSFFKGGVVFYGDGKYAISNEVYDYESAYDYCMRQLSMSLVFLNGLNEKEVSKYSYEAANNQSGEVFWIDSFDIPKTNPGSPYSGLETINEESYGKLLFGSPDINKRFICEKIDNQNIGQTYHSTLTNIKTSLTFESIASHVTETRTHTLSAGGRTTTTTLITSIDTIKGTPRIVSSFETSTFVMSSFLSLTTTTFNIETLTTIVDNVQSILSFTHNQSVIEEISFIKTTISIYQTRTNTSLVYKKTVLPVITEITIN